MCPSGRLLNPHATVADFRPAFEVLDADRDGKISRDDLRAFYAGVHGGVAGGDELIGAMMTVADTNKDGFVEYEEFERVVTGNAETMPVGSGAMEDVFRVMDKDGDGKLSHHDLKTYMAWAGFPATDDDINAMIRFGGGDKNGGVTFDGLLRILALDSAAAN
ncbi:calcium-binding protein CP1 [Vigna unguiculata]|uniref:calcium-binding protein CP1 n=1 Tax=Vigna unguiculata TaxID=3917 RepID=UPI001016D7DB|nr:calcium-binding protein CP1 [Vigna unguiculata]